MFSIAAIGQFAFSIWALSDYSSLYYARTQVVEEGAITLAGYFLKAKEALLNGAISAACMAVFWYIAVRHRPLKPSHA
jgi:hypothetical protein